VHICPILFTLLLNHPLHIWALFWPAKSVMIRVIIFPIEPISPNPKKIVKLLDLGFSVAC
jgi:hypothetical protein